MHATCTTNLISTAFELFEKNNSFETAIPLFLKIVGIRLQLDRITIVDTRIRERSVSRQFQWTSPRAEPVPLNGESYTKEDFLTLFHSYDEYGTTVLQADNMGMYSPQGRALLMQGGAQTVVYAAMYGEGEYQGAIAYVVCGSKRYWTPQNRRELAKIDQDDQRLPEQASGRERREPRHDLCHRFEQYQAQHYPEVRLRVRMGVYAIEPGCLSASAAIDKANFARKQVHSNTRVSAVQFDKKLEVKQTLTGELLSGLPQALENGEFKLYLQPKFSPRTPRSLEPKR